MEVASPRPGDRASERVGGEERPRLRIPLHIKLMVSYLVVVGLVYVPTFVYLRTAFRGQLRANALADLDGELDVLAKRIADAPADQRDEVIGLVVRVMPARVTIVEPNGRVLADTVGAEKLESHAARPEIVQALRDGRGTAERMSTTTRERRLYAARRYPAEGPPRGVVRLSIPTSQVDETTSHSWQFISQASAVALSAAVILSLIAAIVVSRPLQRISRAAQAFAQGDFGHPVEVFSNDELGEVALSLRNLATQLRGTMVASGADSATLHALLDDLPCGVILYDAKGTPLVVSAGARVLCALSGADDFARARQIAELPAQAAARRRVATERRTVTVDLELPWRQGAKLDARWVLLYGQGGELQPSLIVLDESKDATVAELTRVLRRAAGSLRRAAPSVPSFELGRDLETIASDAEAASLPPVAVNAVTSVELGRLWDGALEDLKASVASTGVEVTLDLDERAVRVVEADGRSRQAIRRLVALALSASHGVTELRVRGELGDDSVKLAVRTDAKKPKMGPIAELVQSLGGDAGAVLDGDANDAWLVLPRA